ncbi:MAG: Phosphoserine aminotransferase [bacterium ADurb.Bin429]|nr:MAG: Phosphoserine aminotransferase [bacterium ADurb.Bin429]
MPANYRILFLQGGASLQFSMIPMNFLKASADYVVTGAWGEKAVREARKCGAVNVIFSTKETGFRSVPAQDELDFSQNADYVHYCSNETIDGVEFKYELDGKGVAVVCDASSNILSKPMDIEKYALIYAGAQKNIGPSGLALVIMRKNLVARCPESVPVFLRYATHAEEHSLYNTPNTWGIYFIKLVTDWMLDQGGIPAIQQTNEAKAAALYAVLDGSRFWTPVAQPESRSIMNVCWRLASEDLEDLFVKEAKAAGMEGLKGHRSVGGIRASIYNAVPRACVDTLIEFMSDFERRHG